MGREQSSCGKRHLPLTPCGPRTRAPRLRSGLHCPDPGARRRQKPLRGAERLHPGFYLGQSLRFSASPDQPSQHPGKDGVPLGSGPSQPELCVGLSLLLCLREQRRGDARTCRPRSAYGTKPCKAELTDAGRFLSPKRCRSQPQTLALGEPPRSSSRKPGWLQGSEARTAPSEHARGRRLVCALSLSSLSALWWTPVAQNLSSASKCVPIVPSLLDNFCILPLAGGLGNLVS